MTRSDLMKASQHEVMKLGIPSNYKGFFYLSYAVVLAAEIGMRKASLNKEIYDRIASLNDVTTESVEKCIRNSVQKAWQDHKSSYIKSIGKNGKKPTNSEVIALISNRIRLESDSGF